MVSKFESLIAPNRQKGACQATFLNRITTNEPFIKSYRLTKTHFGKIFILWLLVIDKQHAILMDFSSDINST